MSNYCRLCGDRLDRELFTGNLRGLEVIYFECQSCAYVQTEHPTWLGEAYQSPINTSDTGVMARNISNTRLVLSALCLLNAKKGRVVDYAGGFGFLVRMLRDIGVDAYWQDSYAENLVAKGFEYKGGSAHLVTAFEVFEHFVNPLDEIKRIVDISSNILFTTSLIASPAPLPSDWWYYGSEHGQHIGFFRVKTLAHIAKNLNLNLLTDGVSVHLLSKQKLSSRRWRSLRIISRLNSSLLASGLRPKTWDDHLAVSLANTLKASR